MTLCFVDRQDQGIPHDLWRALFADPSYRELYRTEAQGLVIVCTWVGVWLTAAELAPRHFLVECYRPAAKPCQRQAMLYEEWVASEEKAVQLWQQACAEYLESPPRREKA